MIFLLYLHFTVGLCAISALFKGGIVKLVDSPPITYLASIPSTISLAMLASLVLLSPLTIFTYTSRLTLCPTSLPAPPPLHSMSPILKAANTSVDTIMTDCHIPNST